MPETFKVGDIVRHVSDFVPGESYRLRINRVDERGYGYGPYIDGTGFYANRAPLPGLGADPQAGCCKVVSRKLPMLKVGKTYRFVYKQGFAIMGEYTAKVIEARLTPGMWTIEVQSVNAAPFFDGAGSRRSVSLDYYSIIEEVKSVEDKLREELLAAQADRVAASEAAATATARVGRLRGELNTANQKYGVASKTIGELRDQNARLREKVSGYAADVERLEKTWKADADTKKGLHKRIVDLSVKLDEATTRYYERVSFAAGPTLWRQRGDKDLEVYRPAGYWEYSQSHKNVAQVLLSNPFSVRLKPTSSVPASVRTAPFRLRVRPAPIVSIW